MISGSFGLERRIEKGVDSMCNSNEKEENEVAPNNDADAQSAENTVSKPARVAHIMTLRTRMASDRDGQCEAAGKEQEVEQTGEHADSGPVDASPSELSSTDDDIRLPDAVETPETFLPSLSQFVKVEPREVFDLKPGDVIAEESFLSALPFSASCRSACAWYISYPKSSIHTHEHMCTQLAGAYGRASC